MRMSSSLIAPVPHASRIPDKTECIRSSEEKSLAEATRNTVTITMASAMSRVKLAPHLPRTTKDLGTVTEVGQGGHITWTE